MKLLSYIILILSIQASGEEIKGAFGFKFGEIYNAPKDKAKMIYEVIPKIPYRKFQKYKIAVTSEQKIYLIQSEYTAPTNEEALNELKILEQHLFQKYEKIPKEGIIIRGIQKKNKNDCEKKIYIKDKSISIFLREKTITLLYLDEPPPPPKESDAL